MGPDTERKESHDRRSHFDAVSVPEETTDSPAPAPVSILDDWASAVSRGFLYAGKEIRLSPRTISGYRYRIKAMLDTLSVEDMTEERVAAWVAEHNAGISGNIGTGNRIRGAAISFGKYLAVYHHRGDRLPDSDDVVHFGHTIPWQDEPIRKSAVFSAEQLGAMLEVEFTSFKEPYRTMAAAFLNIAVDTGARPHEIGSLRYCYTDPSCNGCLWSASSDCAADLEGGGLCQRFTPNERNLSMTEDGSDLGLNQNPPRIKLTNAKRRVTKPTGIYRGRQGPVVRVPHRIVPVTPVTRSLLMRVLSLGHRYEWWRGSPWLFCSHGGKAWVSDARPRAMAKVVRLALEERWPDIVDSAIWLGIRHTFITRMIDGGAPLDQVSRGVGHQQLTTTLGYTSLGEIRNIDRFEETVERLRGANNGTV